MNEIREEESIAGHRLCKGITDYLIRISSLAINEKSISTWQAFFRLFQTSKESATIVKIFRVCRNLANQKRSSRVSGQQK